MARYRLVMAEPSWYVLELEFGAPNDALSKQLRATSLEDVQAHLAELDPEELLCDLGLWVVRERRVVELLDLRPFVALGDGEGALRWSDSEACVDYVERASQRGEPVAPRFEWAEFMQQAPALEPPLLAADEEDTVLNPKAMARLSAQRGLGSSWKPSRG